MEDMVNHPNHYEAFRVSFEPADLTSRLPHPLGSAIEYILRSGLKGTQLEDLKKAVWWLDYLLGNGDFWKNTPDGKKQYLVMPEIDDRIRVAAHTALSLKAGIFRDLFVTGTSIIMKENVARLRSGVWFTIQDIEKKSSEENPSADTALHSGEAQE